MTRPEFDEAEIKKLKGKARRSVYYKNALEFVQETIEKSAEDMTEKQITWLWKIKRDLA